MGLFPFWPKSVSFMRFWPSVMGVHYVRSKVEPLGLIGIFTAGASAVDLDSYHWILGTAYLLVNCVVPNFSTAAMLVVLMPPHRYIKFFKGSRSSKS